MLFKQFYIGVQLCVSMKTNFKKACSCFRERSETNSTKLCLKICIKQLEASVKNTDGFAKRQNVHTENNIRLEGVHDLIYITPLISFHKCTAEAYLTSLFIVTAISLLPLPWNWWLNTVLNTSSQKPQHWWLCSFSTWKSHKKYLWPENLNESIFL